MAGCAAGNLAAFAAVAHLRGRTALGDHRVLVQRRPAATVTLIAAFLSLVGIPPLAGFFGTSVLFVAAIGGGFAWLALVGIANSVLSLFFYLRVVAPMVFAEPAGKVQVLGRASGLLMAASAVALAAVIPFLGAIWSALPLNVLP